MIAEAERPEWFFYPGWVAVSAVSLPIAIAVYSLLIRPIAGALGDRIVVGGQSRITEDFLVPYILWPAFALATGVLQYLLLRRVLPRIGWWTVATALGWTLGLFGARQLHNLALSASLDVRSIWIALVKITITGGAIGLAQWTLLRQRVPQSAWWIVANILGWGVGAALSDWLDMWVLVVPAMATVATWWFLLDKSSGRKGSHQTD